MTDKIAVADRCASRTAARFRLTGRVQGIGLRPAVARLADKRMLAGFVGNTPGGVEIHVEGAEENVERFARELAAHLPPAAQVVSVEREVSIVQGCEGFTVRQGLHRSVDRSSNVQSDGSLGLIARVPPDTVTCNCCLAETQDPDNRRYGYAFTSCADCGPRYSILQRMPYERELTGMAGFPLCGSCRAEYDTPADRRFQAQTIACCECGPKLWLRDRSDRLVAGPHDALRAAAVSIGEGRIVALRGLGGYQLLADATSQTAVERLRMRKQRRGKPLAVMVASVREAKHLASLDEREAGWLADPAGPIVVAQMRSEAPLAASVTGGLNTLGLMLPTTPLHALLMRQVRRPLICTSGNREGDPLVYDSAEALRQLGLLADLWLEHDRPILRPVDESVLRVIAGRPVSLRLARGLAPLSLDLDCARPLVALSGHQKSAVAISNGSQAMLGPHVGDLDSTAARERFLDQLVALQQLYGVNSVPLVCDEHPQFFTTGWAEARAAAVMQVQHHHAHVAAGMLEHDWLDREVLGVSFDGTGYGRDATIWGGEFLRSTATGFQRVGHLRPFPLAGGEQAVRQPLRVATALVFEAAGVERASQLVFESGDSKGLLAILNRRKFSPRTTSAGRLFDGIAALVLGIEKCQFEGQAAMLLEAACDPLSAGEYTLPIRAGRSPEQPLELDWRPLVRQVLQDKAADIEPGTMAMRFHRALAAAIVAVCHRSGSLPVVLAGGVFQNRVLVELIAQRYEGRQPLGLPGLIPPGDGGLAAGQLAVASSQLRTGGSARCV